MTSLKPSMGRRVASSLARPRARWLGALARVARVIKTVHASGLDPALCALLRLVAFAGEDGLTIISPQVEHELTPARLERAITRRICPRSRGAVILRLSRVACKP
jgi:hypothetical protein